MAPKGKLPSPAQTIATAKRNLTSTSPGRGNPAVGKAAKKVKVSKPKQSQQSVNLKNQAKKATGSSMW